nr:ATP-dependent RecD-like DNA helicase [Lachnospiraceae bacterium]
KEVQATDARGMKRYLASGAIKGIGEALAERIVKRFGSDTFRIMEEEPERLAEIKGISEMKARMMGSIFEEKSHTRSAMMFMADHGISTNLSLKLYEKYHDEIYSIIEHDPYRLTEEMSGVGFKTADDIAIKAGIERDSGSRIRAGIVYVLSESRMEGHDCLPEEMLKERAAGILGVEKDRVKSELAGILASNRVIRKDNGEGPVIYQADIYYKEEDAAYKLYEIDRALKEEYADKEGIIRQLEELSDIELDEKQRDAAVAAVTNGVVIINGGPGTGKTTLINVLLKYFSSGGMHVMLGAPTGRAAKRLSEATGNEAMTIHRLLEVSGGGEEGFAQFGRDEDNPLETDVIVIDEMSMVDIYLFDALLSAIAPGCRLIMVGDDHQLPSVGPGAVLTDLIKCGMIKVVTLDYVFRQGRESDIILNAHAMLNGKELKLDNSKSDDFYFLERDNEEAIIRGINYLVKEKLSKHFKCDPYEIQVMAPMKKGLLGVINLNQRLKEEMNPPSPEKKEIVFGSSSFRVGDKVMQTKNNYEITWEQKNVAGFLSETGKGVFNGDIGVITDIFDAGYVEVRFDDGREVLYSRENLDELELSFAITIHKSQGSEYPAVVIPVLNGPAVLMTRNILYTAVTRAKRCVMLIGSKKVIQQMVNNNREVLRYTGLDRRLIELYKD